MNNAIFVLGLSLGYILGLLTMVLDRKYMKWLKRRYNNGL